jgi:hypothetical protein
MTRVDSPEEMLPYLNPDYWGGHSIGYGELMGEQPRAPLFGAAQRDAKHALAERVGYMERVIPIETLHDGQVFNPDEYEQGTVVVVRNELLLGNPDKVDGDVESLKGEPIPARPMNTATEFTSETSQSIRDGSLFYWSTARWGIVGRDKLRRAMLYTVSVGNVTKFGGGRVIVTPGFEKTANPLKIGETKHYAKNNEERLVRVNVLDIVAYGEAEKKRERASQLSARLAFGNSH